VTGICECGCGQMAPIASQSVAHRGAVKGQPQRFARGHSHRSAFQHSPGSGTPNRKAPCGCGCGRIVRGRYVGGHGPTKSYRHLDGKRVHVLRAERALSKPLPPKAVVHHADGSKRDDAPLVICQDQAYHALLHVRMRVKAAGGDPDTDAICGHCHAVKLRSAFNSDRTNVLHGTYRWCRECNNAAQRLRREQPAQLRAECEAEP